MTGYIVRGGLSVIFGNVIVSGLGEAKMYSQLPLFPAADGKASWKLVLMSFAVVHSFFAAVRITWMPFKMVKNVQCLSVQQLTQSLGESCSRESANFAAVVSQYSTMALKDPSENVMFLLSANMSPWTCNFAATSFSACSAVVEKPRGKVANTVTWPFLWGKW